MVILEDLKMKYEKYIVNTNMSHDDYAKLAEAVARDNGKPMTDEEATDYIARRYGFQPVLISVKRTAVLWIPDSIGIRKTKASIAREPLYSASDMNYIRFEVCGILYEVVNGHLEFVDE